MLHVQRVDAREGGAHLKVQQLHRDAELALLQRFADADDGHEVVIERGVDLAVDGDVRLVIILAALAVAHDDVAHAGVRQHRAA